MTPSSENNSGENPKPEIFYGWKIVGAASIMGGIGVGVTISGFPVFFLPIREELGITATAMSLIMSLAWAQSGLVAPFSGFLSDRLGTRVLIFWGGMITSLGLLALSLGTEFWHLLILYSLVVAFGRTVGITPTLMTTINQWFVEKKAIAMAIVGTSFTVGGALLIPLLSIATTLVGWRIAICLSGIVIGIIVIPVSLVIRSRPEDLGIQPYGNKDLRDTVPAVMGCGVARVVDFTVRESISTRAFWGILIGLSLRVAVADAIVIHQIPMLVWKGVSAQTAAFYMSTAFILMIPLRLGLGMAANYIASRLILAIAMAIGSLGLTLFLLLDGSKAIACLVLSLGIIEGISVLNWIAIGDYFGRSKFGSISGIMTIFYSIGGLISPVVSGWIFDQTNSYFWVLLVATGLLALSSIAFGFSSKPTLKLAK
jgi:MFS family permease